LKWRAQLKLSLPHNIGGEDRKKKSFGNALLTSKFWFCCHLIALSPIINTKIENPLQMDCITA